MSKRQTEGQAKNRRPDRRRRQRWRKIAKARDRKRELYRNKFRNRFSISRRFRGQSSNGVILGGCDSRNPFHEHRAPSPRKRRNKRKKEKNRRSFFTIEQDSFETTTTEVQKIRQFCRHSLKLCSAFSTSQEGLSFSIFKNRVFGRTLGETNEPTSYRDT